MKVLAAEKRQIFVNCFLKPNGALINLTQQQCLNLQQQQSQKISVSPTFTCFVVA